MCGACRPNGMQGLQTPVRLLPAMPVGASSTTRRSMWRRDRAAAECGRRDNERTHGAVEAAHVPGQSLLAIFVSFLCSSAFDWKDESGRERGTPGRDLAACETGATSPARLRGNTDRDQRCAMRHRGRSQNNRTRNKSNESGSVIPMTRNRGRLDSPGALVTAPIAVAVALLVGPSDTPMLNAGRRQGDGYEVTRMRRRAIAVTLAGIGLLAVRACAEAARAPDGGMRAHVRAAAGRVSAQADAAGHRGDSREQRADACAARGARAARRAEMHRAAAPSRAGGGASARTKEEARRSRRKRPRIRRREARSMIVAEIIPLADTWGMHGDVGWG